MILSVLSSPALVSGLMVARAKNPVHSVLFPIPVFRDTSGLLILLGLDFSAMIFPVVHIGAIVVSFLFVVMMFHIQIAEIHEEVLRYLPVSGIIGRILWWEMFFILDNETIPLLPTQRNTTSLRYTVYAGKVRSWTNWKHWAIYFIPTISSGFWFLELGQSRLLEVDNRVVAPSKTHLRIIVTPADVPHSWVVPSLGVKCDAVPGRLNQISISVQREGVYYGQCSEICGTNHAFTPIVVEAVPSKDYGSRVSNQLIPQTGEA